VIWVISELVTNALNHGLPNCPRTRWARPIGVCLTMQLAHLFWGAALGEIVDSSAMQADSYLRIAAVAAM
jgi:hypothetical protein